ncbi:MAG TPA: hypothetical protein VKV17_13985 [Bryobacteraceae bacterium]|nr:hypothetical protein [Bryobacteraceae bacterium]
MSKYSRLALISFLFCGLAAAQSQDSTIAPLDNSVAGQPVPAPIDKHIFGVLPNYRTTENSYPYQPLTARQKLTIAAKDSFDWPAYVTAAGFAGLYQLENSNPSFRQGVSGYAKRFATAYGDQMLGNMFQEGIVPAIIHQDPRYFRLGEGTVRHRLFYALEQVMVARMDSGKKTFNFSEWGGAAAMTAISNAYYPNSRDWDDNLQKMVIAVATDAFSNVGKEFWPDIKRRLHRHREPGEAFSNRRMILKSSFDSNTR